MSEYLRGSEWRKWDLHIHSNASDGKGTPLEIIQKARELNISVIALTDHHTAKNIDEIKRLGSENGINVISGIEFRTEYGEKSVHIIGLFPDEYNGTVLNQTALHDLILSPLSLSETHIIAKGKESNSDATDVQAFKKGMFEVQADFKKASDLIRKYGGVVTVHAGDKSNSIDKEIKHQGSGVRNVKNLSESLGPLKQELLKDYVDICEVNNSDRKNIDFYLNTFQRVSIVASDAHSVDDIGREYVWIKADPNLNGLKQIIYEPNRVFIGETPPALERIQKNKTKTIDELKINWASAYKGIQGDWFKDINIKFNPEMTVVIGNKGSGKTAVAEIVGLLSNSKNTGDFVFLHKDKFKNKNLAKNFEAELIWKDNAHRVSSNLNDSVDNNADELVHFVPQNSFEKFCNESDEDFIKEINSVVFSRMNKEDKLGFTSFDDLIKSEKSVVESRKSEIRLSIDELNKKIKYIEEKRDGDYKKSLNNSKMTQQRELDEHIKNKPIEIKPPEELNTDVYQQQVIQLKNIDEEIDKEQEHFEMLIKRRSNLLLIRESFENIEIGIKEKIETISTELVEFEIETAKIFKYSLDLEPINSLFTKTEQEIVKSQKLLGVAENTDPNNIESSLMHKRNEIQKVIEKFNEENKGKLTQYQKFISDTKEWDATNKKILDKIKELDTQLNYIGDFRTSELITDLENLKLQRKNKIRLLFKCYKDEQAIYDKFKYPIVKFLENYQEQLENFNTEINSGIYIKEDFANTFVDLYIDNTVNSAFKGVEGSKKIKEFIAESDFATEEGLVAFIDLVQGELEKKFEEKCYHGIFKKDKYDLFVSDFYKLTYLDARYSLQLFGKELKSLSPGERGSLLLVFYLLLDARDTPLILDQPEDNLDNQSVAEILVPFIRAAKQRRQIIIITHNSNLAVVSEAEQVIRVKIDKIHNNKFTFESGSLESKIINDVVDVLEGTIHSFNIRKNKYPKEG